MFWSRQRGELISFFDFKIFEFFATPGALIGPSWGLGSGQLRGGELIYWLDWFFGDLCC